MVVWMVGVLRCCNSHIQGMNLLLVLVTARMLCMWCAQWIKWFNLMTRIPTLATNFDNLVTQLTFDDSFSDSVLL